MQMPQEIASVQSKLNKSQMYNALGEEEKAFEVLRSVTDEEIEVLEITAKGLLKMVSQLRELKEEK